MLCRLILLLCAAFVSITAAAAQQTLGSEARPSPGRVYTGLTFMGGVAPQSLLDRCSPDATPAAYPMVGGGVFTGMTVVGALDVEAHVMGISTPRNESPCTEAFASGVHEQRIPDLEPSDFIAGGLRLRLAPESVAPWSASAEAGYTWPTTLPYLGLGIGLDMWSEAGHHLQFDLGWSAYRVPYHIRIARWRDFGVQEELSDTPARAWQSGLRLQLGVRLGGGLPGSGVQ